MAEERDDLKRRHETARQRNEFLEVEVKKMAKEIDDFSRENNSIRQGHTLLEQDKEYHSRVIRSARIFSVEWEGLPARTHVLWCRGRKPLFFTSVGKDMEGLGMRKPELGCTV